MKILDCTLRDGGYYTNWDFEQSLVKTYLQAFNHLPVDYLEIGYRSNPMKEYLGEYFYCPDYALQQLSLTSQKKLVVILNEKDVRPEDVIPLLGPCKDYISMVRIALDPKNMKRAVTLAEKIKTLGFEIGFNVMYMSKWKQESDFLNNLSAVQGIADIFYMVDSYGGIYPQQVKETYEMVKSLADIPIGFHGHNNMELALINSLTAIECGADMIDATVTGMGRGAGNLKTELLLTALHARGEMEVDFNALSSVVDAFTQLQQKYEWGTNLPYMVSGANSLPQKEVMDWVGKRYFSFNSIIRALHNQKNGVEDNIRFPIYQPQIQFTKALMLGGGPSVVHHAEAIKRMLQKEDNICLIHASAKNAIHFAEVQVPQFFCLAGNEGNRLAHTFSGFDQFEHTCLLPAYPRKMGTYVPEKVQHNTFELQEVQFTQLVKDSHTALALQTAIQNGATTIYIAGYDGYLNNQAGTKEQELLIENEALFLDAAHFGLDLYSLTPTQYTSLKPDSVFAKL